MIPNIDFKFWLDFNQKLGIKEKRHHALITKIERLFLSNSINQTYFSDNPIEINRLKKLNYNQFENEILSLIIAYDIYSNNDFNLLKIFDLIQIWGGLFGGSNFYQLNDKNQTLRLNYIQWLEEYRNLIKLSINANPDAYEILKNGKIPNLRMSFGSKHISFWSRKINENNCLVIIDNKIAGTFGYLDSTNVDYRFINHQILEKSNSLKLEPYQIEKALFSFHSFYFNNSNTKFKGYEYDPSERINFKEALSLAEKLTININNPGISKLIASPSLINEPYKKFIDFLPKENISKEIHQLNNAKSFNIITCFEDEKIIGIIVDRALGSNSIFKFLSISIFNFVIKELLLSTENTLKKGNGTNALLGETGCELDSIEGKVATEFFDKIEGDSVFRRSSVICNILVESGVCNNSMRGFLKLNL